MIAYISAPLKFYNYVIMYPQTWKHLEYQNFLGNLERIVFCKELFFLQLCAIWYMLMFLKLLHLCLFWEIKIC